MRSLPSYFNNPLYKNKNIKLHNKIRPYTMYINNRNNLTDHKILLAPASQFRANGRNHKHGIVNHLIILHAR